MQSLMASSGRLPVSVMAPGEIAEVADEIMDDTQRADFKRDLEINLAVSISGVGRFRVNIFNQRNEVSIVCALYRDGHTQLERSGPS